MSNWHVLAQSCAVALQLVRLSVDLIQVASAVTTTEEGTSAKYGTAPVSSTEAESSPPSNDEEQPLVGSSQRRGVVNQLSLRIQIFFLTLVTLLVVFVTLWILGEQSTADVPSSGLYASTIFVVTLELALLHRDTNKRRHGIFHRSLHQWTGLILWLQYLNTYFLKSSGGISSIALLTSTVHFLSTFFVPSSSPTNTEVTPEAPMKATLSRKAIFTLLKPYFWPDATSSSATANRARAIGTWVCVVASKVCNLTSPLFLGWASTALAHQNYHKTIQHAVYYSIFSWLGSTFKEGQSLVYLKVAQAAYVQLATTTFRHLHSLSLDWHLRKKMGVVLRSVNRGIAACDTLMKYLFLWLVPALAECLVVCVIFATYFSYLPLAIAVFYFVFAYIVWTILVTLWRKKFRKALTQSDNAMEDRFVDSMINFETVKYFTAEDYEAKKFSEAVQRYQAGSVQVQGSLSFLNVSQQVLLKTCLAVALSLSALGIQKRIDCCVDDMGCESGISECCLDVSGSQCPGMQVGDFVTVLTYTTQLFQPLNFLGSVYNSIVMAVIDLTSMSELLAEAPDVSDAPNAIDLPVTSTNGDKDAAVEFDNVTFHYPTQPSGNGLRGLSFKMKRGTTTAIVGPTGAGKTTVSRLLFRYYDVLGGCVRINGIDVRYVTQKSLRQAIGVVPQAASLFNDTLRANLLYGKRDATDEELRQAATSAQILSFIQSLEDGWETVVGDRGLKLSGGEKQRVAICRCLLKNPDFVLLDEATSALDTLTEKSVQEALDRLGQDRSVLVVAHRLGTIRHADNIVVLKDGVAAEQGTHDQLLLKNGIYADMWNMQVNSTASTSRDNLVSI